MVRASIMVPADQAVSLLRGELASIMASTFFLFTGLISFAGGVVE